MNIVGAGAAGAASAGEISRPKEKRLKTVFSKTAEVAAVWAAQDRAEARTSSNTWFRGDTLYSYGTPIARIIRAVDHRPAVALVSSKSWSSGTSKVQGEAASAAFRLGIAVYRVPRLGVAHDDVSENLGHFQRRIAEAVASIGKAVRLDTARSHRAEALRLIGVAHVFSTDMGWLFRWVGENPLTVRNAKEDF